MKPYEDNGQNLFY